MPPRLCANTTLSRHIRRPRCGGGRPPGLPAPPVTGTDTSLFARALCYGAGLFRIGRPGDMEPFMPRRKKTPTAPESASSEAVTSIKYPATRKNIPPAGLEAQGFVREEAAVYHRHDPHLPPVLRSSPDPAATDRLQELLATARQRALSGEEAGILAAALERYEPWLEWSGKRERPWFEVDPVALHMHERVSTQAVLRVLAREDVHRDLFADPQQDYAKAVQFYFHCRTVPHVTLRSIARNTSLDPIFDRHEPILAGKLAALNREVAKVGANLKSALAAKLVSKHREEGAAAVTDADLRRWLLPDAPPESLEAAPARKPLKGLTARQVEKYREKIPRGEWREWETPFDTDPDWPEPLREALTEYRAAWRAKMDEVDECIAANAASEELVDKPEIVKGTVRVSGPFTMEGVIAVEEGPDHPDGPGPLAGPGPLEGPGPHSGPGLFDDSGPLAGSPSPIGGAPGGELEVFEADDAGDVAVANAEAHLDKVIRLLEAAGVDFPGNRNMMFGRIEPLTGAALIHAEGEWLNGTGEERRVAVSIGPEVGNVAAMQVEDAIRSANRAGYDDVVFAGFGFDAAAQDAIESASHPKLRLHMALIRPDVVMDDLLKTQPGSQLFTVFSAPRVKGPMRREDGEYVVEVEGMDVYDPVSNMLFPTDRHGFASRHGFSTRTTTAGPSASARRSSPTGASGTGWPGRSTTPARWSGAHSTRSAAS